MKLILGSQSPRRKEILSYFTVPFEQVTPPYDEKGAPLDSDPIRYVCALSKGKADSLAHLHPEATILTADTIVCSGGKIYGKPESEEELCQFLKELSGSWHSVFTSLTVASQGKDFYALEETRVLFNLLTEKEIRLYAKSLPLLDKAGGYMIQGAGGVIVNRIEGCYYNVMGLPINALCSVLKLAGIDLWEALR